MAAYARTRYTEGLQLATAHRVDATGCCASCGRETPCPDQVEGERLVQLYRAWLNPDPAEPTLIRPYVRNAGTW